MGQKPAGMLHLTERLVAHMVVVTSTAAQHECQAFSVFQSALFAHLSTNQ